MKRTVPSVEPLSYTNRRRTFLVLVFVFVVSLPFLFLYATGYRFDLARPTSIVSTGGMYIAVDRTGAEIYIDNELMRETRVFRRAFYAQSLDVGTHRVHVQKEGHHTWVKELPVSRHLVTEAEAFNLPLVPQIRVIAEWQSATGSMIVRAPITHASTTNATLATSTKSMKLFTSNPEFQNLLARLSTSSTSSKKETPTEQIREFIRGTGTTSPDQTDATTSVIASGVELYSDGEDVYATWIGPFEQMPYYYCAADFPRYSTSSLDATSSPIEIQGSDITANTSDAVGNDNDELVMHPVQTVSKDTVCDPVIRIDRRGQTVHDFQFLPGSTDFVILAQDDGIYVVEIDDRSWQNIQPLMEGKGLHLLIENGSVYVYDGTLIYQVLYNV